MFTQNAIRNIAILLVFTIGLSSTGVIEASTNSVPESTPLVPLTDHDMAKIEGGLAILTGIAIFTTIVGICVTIWGIWKRNTEPVGAQPFPQVRLCVGGNDYLTANRVKKMYIQKLYNCADPNQPSSYTIILDF